MSDRIKFGKLSQTKTLHISYVFNVCHFLIFLTISQHSMKIYTNVIEKIQTIFDGVMDCNFDTLLNSLSVDFHKNQLHKKIIYFNLVTLYKI